MRICDEQIGLLSGYLFSWSLATYFFLQRECRYHKISFVHEIDQLSDCSNWWARLDKSREMHREEARSIRQRVFGEFGSQDRLAEAPLTRIPFRLGRDQDDFALSLISSQPRDFHVRAWNPPPPSASG